MASRDLKYVDLRFTLKETSEDTDEIGGKKLIDNKKNEGVGTLKKL